MKKCMIKIPSMGFTYQTQDEVLRNEAEEVSSFDELFDKIAQLAVANSNVLLFYRGQKADYKIGSGKSERTSILPSIYRNYVRADELSKRWEKLHLAERILLEKLKQKDPKKYRLAIRKKIILWSILQHYEVTETPLIDITQSLRVACSFAAIGNTSGYAYIYILGLPYYTNRISVNSEEYLTNIRLLSIAPPDAKRPYLQEGFLIGEDEFDEVIRGTKDELDLSRRLIYKFKIRIEHLDNNGFLLTEDKLLPLNDPIALVCEDVKNEMNKQTYAPDYDSIQAIALTKFITVWQKIESMLTTNFIHRDSVGRYNLSQAIYSIEDKKLAEEINSLRMIRNRIIHGSYNEPIQQELIDYAENICFDIEKYISEKK